LIVTAKKLSKFEEKEDQELNIAFMALDKESLKLKESTLKTLESRLKCSERVQLSLE